MFYITIQKIIKKRLAYKDIIRYLYSVIKRSKKWLKQKGIDYYELQDKYSEVAGYKPTIEDLEIKYKVLKTL